MDFRACRCDELFFEPVRLGVSPMVCVGSECATYVAIGASRQSDATTDMRGSEDVACMRDLQ